MFTDHSEIKLEFNNKMIEKSTSVRRFVKTKPQTDIV